MKAIKNMPPVILNVFWLTGLSVLLSVQVLAVAAWFMSYFPQEQEVPFTVLNAYKNLFRPEQEIHLYRIFVFSAILLQALSAWVFRKRLADPVLSRRLQCYVFAETFAVFTLLLVSFKMALSGPTPYLRLLFLAALCLAVILKIFWLLIERGLSRLYKKFCCKTLSLSARRLCYGLVFLGIVLVIYVPPDIALTCFTDNYIHIDAFALSPAWASFKGHVLNVDTISAYGVGMPTLLARLSPLLGGLSYETVLLEFMCLAILYFILMYLLINSWLKNLLLALLGVLIMIKMHMFSHGPEHFIWQTPSATLIRYFWDVVFFTFLLKHLQTGKRRYQWAAGFCVGLALCYLTDTGLYLLMALYVYMLLSMLIPGCRDMLYPSRKDLFVALCLFFVPLLCYGCGMMLLVGRALFQPDFWTNTGEMMTLFLHGFGPLPIYTGLQDKQFFNFFLSLIIPLTYVISTVLVTTLVALRQINPRNIYAVIWSIYGLGLYHYFICRSGPTSFYAVSIPFVLILCYWLHLCLKRMDPGRQKVLLCGMLFVWGMLMMTDASFIRYPRVVNLSGTSYQERLQKFAEYRAQHYISPEDIAMIRSMTDPREKVCLISSWDTATLVAADRRPFFYYFRFVTPRTMDGLDFGGTDLITQERLDKTIRQLDTEKPGLVFIEKKLFAAEIPSVYYAHYQDLFQIVQYLRQHYTPVTKGKYLLALKRK